jgi:hypothetical protein
MNTQFQTYGRRAVNPIAVNYTGGDTLTNGMLVAYDHDASTAAARESNVEKPSYGNLMAGAFAGVVCSAPSGGYVGNSSSVPIWIIPDDGTMLRNVEVLTDQNVAAGDFLAPIPGSYYAGRAVFGPFAARPPFRAAEAVDGSTTAALVEGAFGFNANWDVAAKTFRMFQDFDGSQNVFLGGATPAEIAVPGMVLSGATVAGAWTNDAGGRIALTPTTTTIAQLNVGGVAAGTASAMAFLPFTLSAGKSIFFRAKANFGVGAIDNSCFLGLAITGASVSNAAVPALDDYLGFFKKVDDDGSLFFATNRDNGTDNLTDTGINTVADTMYDVAFLAVNRVTGDAASATTVYVWVDGVLVATISSAAINALINKDEAMGIVFGGIDGAAAVVIELDRFEAAINL